jgi:hypothetical protein
VRFEPKRNYTLSVATTTAYKIAATKAPKPRMLPAATFMLFAALADCDAAAPERVADPLPDARAPEPDAAEPDPDATGVEVWICMVVLLFALTTMVRVWLNMEPVPGRVKVWRPGPTAGISAGSGCEVTTAGCEVTTAGWPGCEVMATAALGCEVKTAGMPVTTPRELVCLR